MMRRKRTKGLSYGEEEDYILLTSELTCKEAAPENKDIIGLFVLIMECLVPRNRWKQVKSFFKNLK